MIPWEPAWQEALYGPDGFFTTGDGPAAHFRTAVHAAPEVVAEAIARLARATGRTGVVDVGCGRGELTLALARRPAASGLRLHGVDVVARPAGLPARIGWSQGVGALPADVLDDALVVAWELLDDVPCPVAEVDEDGIPRLVLVDPRTGREDLGEPLTGPDAAWCDRWWPAVEPGDRLEVGRPRDDLWSGLVRRAATTPSGADLLAVDYHHTRATRPALGSLTGFRRGRAVPPVPDGSGNVTAHVAIDAVAAAGEAVGARTVTLTDQRSALTALFPDTPLPSELTTPGALADFAWLHQSTSPTSPTSPTRPSFPPLPPPGDHASPP